MSLLLLGVAALTLDSHSTPAPDDDEWWITGQCHSQPAEIATRLVAVVQCDQGDMFGSSIATYAGAIGSVKLVEFDAGNVTWSTAHMTEDRDRAKRDGVVISPGTLADGSPAAVIRIDWVHQDYREGKVGNDLGVVWRGPWTKHADVIVCSIGESPACSEPIRVDGHPAVSLRAGKLRIGRQSIVIGS